MLEILQSYEWYNSWKLNKKALKKNNLITYGKIKIRLANIDDLD